MLREAIDNYQFESESSEVINNEVKNIVNSVVGSISTNSNLLITSELKTCSSVRPIFIVDSITNIKTPMQLAAEQLAKQQGVECNPLYFNDVELQTPVKNINSFLLGTEYVYELHGVEDNTFLGRINIVYYNPVNVKSYFDKCGLKAKLYFSYKGTMKQLTLTLIGQYDIISSEVRKKFNKLIGDAFEELGR